MGALVNVHPPRLRRALAVGIAGIAAAAATGISAGQALHPFDGSPAPRQGAIKCSAFAGRELQIPIGLEGSEPNATEVRADLYRIVAGRAAPVERSRLLVSEPVATPPAVPNQTPEPGGHRITATLTLPGWQKPGTLLVKLWLGARGSPGFSSAGALEISVVTDDILDPLARLTPPAEVRLARSLEPDLAGVLKAAGVDVVLVTDDALGGAGTWTGVYFRDRRGKPVTADGPSTRPGPGQVVVDYVDAIAGRDGSDTVVGSRPAAAAAATGIRIELATQSLHHLADNPEEQMSLMETLRSTRRLGKLK